MGPGAEDIAEIVSGVRGRLPGLRTPPQLGPEQARFRLFHSITIAVDCSPMDRDLDEKEYAMADATTLELPASRRTSNGNG